MFTTILVPLDGTPEAASALPLARVLLSGAEPRLILVRVVASLETADDAEQYVRGVVTDFGPGAPCAETHVLCGAPGERIVHAAAAYGAAGVVMATHARTELGRLILGSVAEEVVAASPAPVVLTHPGVTHVTPIRSLLIPLDGSPGSKRALAMATQLARAYGAKIDLVTVIRGMPGYVAKPLPGVSLSRVISPTWQSIRQSAEDVLQQTVKQLRRGGLEAAAHAVIGEAAQGIVSTADNIGTDLIVMSTHALRGPVRGLLGSVAAAVVREATCPVLLVRRN
jgi:nucleotide-binding universal stress UspA family protein